MKKTELQKKLAKDFSWLSIETLWRHDEHATWDVEDSSLNPEDFRAWRSEIKCSVIEDGELIHGSAFLGGTWEKWGDNPHVSNPTISGYEMQMTVEALEVLSGRCAQYSTHCLAASNCICGMMRDEYEAQQTTLRGS